MKPKALTLKILREDEGDSQRKVLFSEFTGIEDTAARELPAHVQSWIMIPDEGGEMRFAPGWPLFLTNLKSLSLAAAIALSRHEGFLLLSGVERISDRAAKYLGQHEGALHLDGLTFLSDVAASHLGRHVGYLGLGGLTEISPCAAGHLSGNAGSLRLAGLAGISDEVAAMLCRHVGILFLGEHTTMSAAARAELVQHDGPVMLSKVNLLTGETQKVETGNENQFPHHKDDPVGRRRLEESPQCIPWPEVATRLGMKTTPRLTLKNLRQYMEIAADNKMPPSKMDELDRIILGAIEEIEDEAARELPLHAQSSARIVDEDDEERWAPGRPIQLGRLKSLSKAAAIALAKHEGPLILDGLASISDGVARALGKHEGELHMNGLTSLSDVAAKHLSEHRGPVYFGEKKLAPEFARPTPRPNSHPCRYPQI